MRTVLLGPQRRPTLDTVALDGPIATVTAGWQEREPDDAELDGLLGGRSVNLRLYSRWQDVLARDPEYAAAEKAHRAELDTLHELYAVQLDGALTALTEVARRSPPPTSPSGSKVTLLPLGDSSDTLLPLGGAAAADSALGDAVAVVRLVDAQHLARFAATRDEFAAEWGSREVLDQHRAEVAQAGGAALVVAGGHVGVLVRLFRMFAVPRPPVLVAWSAGAMALTDRVLLFHDRAPHGLAHAEFAGAGLGWIPGCVLLPHARKRLRTDDPARMTELAARAAPARCVVLDNGVRLDLDGALPAGAKVVTADGRIEALP